MKILERNGFVQYSGNNLWIKYDYIDNKKVPILFSTVKKNGDVVITNNDGDVLISSNDETKIEEVLKVELRDIFIKSIISS